MCETKSFLPMMLAVGCCLFLSLSPGCGGDDGGGGGSQHFKPVLRPDFRVYLPEGWGAARHGIDGLCGPGWRHCLCTYALPGLREGGGCSTRTSRRGE